MSPEPSDHPGAQPERPQRVALDPGLLVGSTDDEILRSYLDLVRRWRGTPQRSALRLRQTDVATLVAILGTDGAEITRRLVAATACTPRAARRGRRLLLAALALGLAGSPIAGAATLAPVRMPAGALPSSAAPATSRQGPFDQPDQIDRPDRPDRPDRQGVVPSPPAVPYVASAPPDPVVVAPVDQADGVGAIAAPPPEADAMLTVASLGIELPIIAGGQSVIDRGVVAHYWAPGWEAPVPPGAAGTYWLAAHNATRGEPFRALPDLAVGAEVRVTTSSQTFIYTVTSTEVTGLYPGDQAVYGSDPAAAAILLQTCLGSTQRLLVRGTLTATL